MSLGDFPLGATVYSKFTTRRFSTGAPFTLAGTPAVSVYEDDSTTEITAGITLTVDFDSRTGLNHLTLVATSGNGYETGKSYAAVITAGTVDAVSVVGEVVAQFTIERSAAFSRLGAPAGASVSADIAAVQSDTNDIQTRLPAALVSGRIDASVGAMAAGVVTAAAVATGAIDADALAADAVAEIADGVWDEDATGHQTQGSFGQAIGDPGADTDTIFGLVNTNLDATVSSRASSAQATSIQADTDDLQTRIPAALVGGRIDASVGAMAAGTLTAAAVATGAIDADAIAADAVAEIQAGLATSADVAAVQADTDNLQTRLPAALVSGRMDSSVGAMAANTLTASALAADAVTEIQAAVLSDATPFAGANIDATISSRATPAQVNTEVLDVLNVDTFALPGQTAPPLAPTLVQTLTWLFKNFRNRKTQTATQWSLMADNETTVDSKAVVSDDGTTAIKQEVVSGP